MGGLCVFDDIERQPPSDRRTARCAESSGDSIDLCCVAFLAAAVAGLVAGRMESHAVFYSQITWTMR